MKRLLSILVLALAACTTPPAGTSPAQQALNTTATACKNVDAAIVATDQAVLTGLLKGQDARNAVKGLTAAQQGCVVALASFSTAASGASK